MLKYIPTNDERFVDTVSKKERSVDTLCPLKQQAGPLF